MAFLDKHKKTGNESFIALLINEQSVQAGIWQIEGNKTKIISVGEKQGWSGKTDELVESVDLSLSEAVARLVEVGKKEPEKIIFGLPHDWTQAGKITDQKLDLLKKLSTKLSLKPIGFVVATEALVHFLKTNEGASVSTILIQINADDLRIVLIHLGEILGVEKVARSDSLALDVEEGLLRFPKEETFPPRMILYGEADLEAEKQILVSYPWQEPERKLPFLHVPRIEIAEEDFEIKALCLAGGTEMAKSEELISEDAEKPAVVEHKQINGQQEQDLGFVVGKDVLAEIGKKESPGKPDDGQTEPLKSEEKVAQVEQVEKVGVKNLLGLILTRIRVPRLRLAKLRLPSFAFAPPKLALVGLFLVILGGGFLVFKTIPRAQITIFVSPEELKEELELTLDPSALVWDEKEKILPAQTLEASVSQSKTKTTTGKKTIGEKAKGEITIYNRTDDQKSFSAGTVLGGPGDLKFTLDSEVSIASKTPDLVSGVDKWGEVKVEVTAVDIGAEYNLAADSQFKFEKFSSSLFLAKNTTAFSGGTSRQIQVVSEEDKVSLKKDLEGELTAKAKEEILKKASGGKYFVEESLQTDIAQEEYSRKVGEETQEVSLTLEIKATGLTFEENSLRDLARLFLKDKIGAQDFRWEEAKLDSKVLEINSDGSVQLKVMIAGKLYPGFSAEETAQNLAGKGFAFQKNYLDNLPRVTGFKTEITPAFFARLKRLPSRAKNIKVEIKPE